MVAIEGYCGYKVDLAFQYVAGMQCCMAVSFYNVLISHGILALFVEERK